MHEQALTKEASVLFPELAKFEEFYLVGGTALALQIGHRLSVDFDMFSSGELPINLLQKIKRTFSGSSVAVTYSSHEQLNVVIGGVQATFLSYPYPIIDPLISYREVSLAGVREIAAMKAFSLGKRLSYKDYVDWYFLLHEKHVLLEKVIALSQKKFRNDFNDRLFLGQLTLMEDIPFQKIEFLRDPVDQATVQKFLKEAVRLAVR